MLGAEEDGFALEHLDGEEEGSGGVDAGRCKDDDDVNERHDVALRFFVALGECRDGDQDGREKDRQRNRHDENGKSRAKADVQGGALLASLNGSRAQGIGDGEGDAHRNDGDRSSGQRGCENQQELAKDQMRARNRTRKNRFHGAALFFARGEVHGRMHAAVQAQKYNDVGDKAAKEERTAGLFRRRNIVRFDRERLQDADGEISGGEALFNDGVAILVEIFLDFVLGNFGFEIAFVVVNEDGLFHLAGEIAFEAFGDFDNHGNLLVDDFFLPIRSQRNDLNLRYFFQSRENVGRSIAANDHDFRSFFFRLSD